MSNPTFTAAKKLAAFGRDIDIKEADPYDPSRPRGTSPGEEAIAYADAANARVGAAVLAMFTAPLTDSELEVVADAIARERAAREKQV